MAQAGSFDGFLSYASSDSAKAYRIQRFLESYRHPQSGVRPKIYRDETDIRGGPLGGELQTALDRTSCLVVCVSPAAVDSDWVQKEAAFFVSNRNDRPIATLLIEGDTSLGERIEALVGLDVRFHDLRRGWVLGFLRPSAKSELLRLLSLVFDVDLRTLRNWRIRRAIRNATMIAIVSIALIWGLLSIPVFRWEKVALDIPRTGLAAATIDLVAAWGDNDRLIIVERVPGRTDDYTGIMIWDDVLNPARRGPWRPGHFVHSGWRAGPKGYPTKHRLLLPIDHQKKLPESVYRFDFGQAGRKVVEDIKILGGSMPVIFAGEPEPGIIVAVRPLELSESERVNMEVDALVPRLQGANPQGYDQVGPLRSSWGAAIAVFSRREAADLAGNWVEAPETSVNMFVSPSIHVPWELWEHYFKERWHPVAPSIAPSVAWDGESLWLGVRTVDEGPHGGLWRSSNMGEQWEKVDGFNNVSSISVRVSKGARAIVVAESGVVLWEEGKRSRYQANVRSYEGHNKKWSVGSMPDFDDGAEIELCGILPSGEYVRVDNTLFRKDHHSLVSLFFAR